MKYKIAICETHMVGSTALAIGICRYDDDDAFWSKYQIWTWKELLDTKYVCVVGEWSIYKNQQECDAASEQMRNLALSRKKYHGNVIHFTSIDKDVKVFSDGRHDFDFTLAEAVELTKAELQLLEKELSADGMQDFDWETWGK